MRATKQWRAEIMIGEDDGRTYAEARLITGTPNHLVGIGRAKVSPDDVDVPEIGDEVAVGASLARSREPPARHRVRRHRGRDEGARCADRVTEGQRGEACLVGGHMSSEGRALPTRGAGRRCAPWAMGTWASAAPSRSTSADGVHYPGTYVAGCYNRLRDSVDGN